MFSGIDPRRRLVIYLLINVVVSALTTLLVLVFWTRFSLSSAPTLLDGTPVSQSSDQVQISAVIGAGDADNESVLIEQVGDKDISLAGWRLRDEDGNEYRFPALVLHSGARVSLFTRQGDDGASELFWDRQIPVWESGELATLSDPSGRRQASYTVP